MAKTDSERAAKARMKRISMGVDEVRVMVPASVKRAVVALAKRHDMTVKEALQTAVMNIERIELVRIDEAADAEIRCDVAPGIARMLAEKFAGDQNDAISCLCVTLAVSQYRDALLELPRHNYTASIRAMREIKKFNEEQRNTEWTA